PERRPFLRPRPLQLLTQRRQLPTLLTELPFQDRGGLERCVAFRDDGGKSFSIVGRRQSFGLPEGGRRSRVRRYNLPLAEQRFEDRGLVEAAPPLDVSQPLTFGACQGRVRSRCRDSAVRGRLVCWVVYVGRE